VPLYKHQTLTFEPTTLKGRTNLIALPPLKKVKEAILIKAAPNLFLAKIVFYSTKAN
jgi:hypothetical protein